MVVEKNIKNIALIPARSGSKRIINKNIRDLAGHPLMAYTIRAAISTKLFSDVIVVTDSTEYAAIGRDYGASSDFLRPSNISGEYSSDIEWLTWCILQYGLDSRHRLFILRPTNPLRTSNTILKAGRQFEIHCNGFDSLRALSPSNDHPGKMWVVRDGAALPLLPFSDNSGVPWHNQQKSSLSKVFVQNASLEIINSSTVKKLNSLSGSRIIPYILDGYEGFDINTPNDFRYLEFLLSLGEVKLPRL